MRTQVFWHGRGGHFVERYLWEAARIIFWLMCIYVWIIEGITWDGMGLSFLKVKYKTKTGKQTNKPPLAMLCSWAWESKARSVDQHGRLAFSWCQMPWSTGVERGKGCAELFTAFSRSADTSLFHLPVWHHYLLNSKSIAPALPSCCGWMFIFSHSASFMAFGLLSGADVSTCGLSS